MGYADDEQKEWYKESVGKYTSRDWWTEASEEDLQSPDAILLNP